MIGRMIPATTVQARLMGLLEIADKNVEDRSAQAIIAVAEDMGLLSIDRVSGCGWAVEITWVKL